MDLEKYRELLKIEMLKNGAKESDLNLITDEILKNSIANNRTPEDVAWAILQ